MVCSWVLRMDRLGSESPVGAAVDGSAVVGDCFGGVLHGPAVVADHGRVVQRCPTDSDAILGSLIADLHRRRRIGDSFAR